MAHGTHCGCMMCTVGKKVGMIHDEHDMHDGHRHDNSSNQVCKDCGHGHKEDGHCGCGCK